MKNTRKSGILLHPTSLPTQFGIGDFGQSSFEFIERLAKAKQSLWQILPLCPIDFTNSPYQSTSAFAGEPLLISLEKLRNLGLLTDAEIYANTQAVQLKTDYTFARRIKEPLFELAFQRFQEKQLQFFDAYEAFQEQEHYWLPKYTLFMSVKNFLIKHRQNKTTGVLRDLKNIIQSGKKVLPKETLEAYFYNGFWCTFPNGLRNCDRKTMRTWTLKLSRDIAYHTFLQFMFYLQWNELKTFANEKGIKIIGDMPIFVAYDSADVWQNQDDFLLNANGFPTAVAGVPPDYFSETGQLWGNPLYDFKAQKRNNYKWWARRLEKALRMADIVRIDHFRGFESFWKIPVGSKDATSGTWVKGPNMEFFKVLRKRLNMKELPVIAEDLGIITDEVRALRDATGFAGMRILQFAFGQDKNNGYLPHVYDKNTVVYTGTHDNATTKAWYENASYEVQDHYRRYLNASGEDVSWDLIRLAFASVADTVIIPLQDVLNLDGNYNMNTPGTANDNWGFAFSYDMWNNGHTEGLAYLSELFGRNDALVYSSEY